MTAAHCWRRAIVAAWAIAQIGAASAEPAKVEVDSLDQAQGGVVRLPGYWFPAAGAKPIAPAMLLLHGCSGPYDRSGQLGLRMVEYAALLNAEGVHVLVTDSFTPRGEREICTQKTGTRKVTQLNRRRDALGALQWLAAQPGVDVARLGLLGWSNGGSNVLAATNSAHAEVRRAPVKPAFAVAFYPGCEDERRRGYQPVAPLLMLLGGADDWTPPQPCEAMAVESAVPRPEVVLYPGVYHGFDGTSRLQVLANVPNGVNPGQGVHMGGDASARVASRTRLLEFVRQMGLGR
ncbi:MAG: dienelactone hydrolase family protein [Ideonella sp.]|nr:dienelactone hydrolase family protein [Ideonella sp.]